MICVRCNNSISDSARFCNTCGTEVPSEITQEARAKQSANDPLIGSSIGGKYRIYAKLGSGGMGAVYRAQRTIIGDDVAIKILHFNQNESPEAERFRREAQAAARLKHAHAVSIFDFGISDDGRQYLVMELVEGESLRQLIKRQGRLSPAFAAEIISQVCAALDEAHRHNIVHRDIKPDNIIVDRRGAKPEVTVLDFGIAKLRGDSATTLTQTGSVLGTPHYMSPEQCLGEELDGRSDIYSLGIVLYEMLTGLVPFNSPISTAVVVQHVNHAPPSLRGLNPAIPWSVERAVLHALEKRPEARPSTPGAFAAELTAAVANSSAEPAVQRDQIASTPTVVLSNEQHFRSFQVEPVGQKPAGGMTTTKTVALTILVTLVLVALGGFGFRTLFGAHGEADRPEQPPIATQSTSSVGPTVNPSPRLAPSVATLTPAPVVVNTSLLTSEVNAVLDSWAGAARAHNLDLQMTYYTDVVSPYFGRRSASRAEIRADRSVAYRRYPRLDIQLSNINVVFDSSGTQATATFDKSFTFSSDERSFSGMVNTRVWLTKFGPQWLITGEKDLKVYSTR
jgi:serine/threonine protein kinase